ncbi:MAG: hypothetical protein ACPHQ8_10310 [Candidatus Puniceispirillaceae bacterium]
MTAKQTSDTDPEIIEGVAVEKSAASAGRRRSAGRGKSRSEKSAPKQRPASAAPDDGTPDRSAGDSRAKSSSNAADNAAGASPAGVASERRDSMPVILGVAAILLVLAGIAVQQWMVARQESQLHIEIEALTVQLDTVNELLARAQGDIAAMRTGQEKQAARLAGLEAELPRDPAEALAALSTRLDAFAADLAARPVGGGRAQTEFDSGPALAQAAIGAVTAMNAANLDGGDPAQWVPVLQELARAGLDIGDLAGIEALLAPRPPTTTRLLAEAAGLANMIGRDQDDAAGWWQNTTGRIAGFIRLRRSDDMPSTEDGAVAESLPLDRFARAIRSDGLAAALAASRKVAPPPAGLAGWQAKAQRRLDLDAALAGLMVEMTARLAATRVTD